MFDKIKMLQQAKQLQSQLADMSITEESNGIKIVMNGKQELLELEIAEELFNDQERLSRLLKQALNSAIKKAQIEAAKQMQATGGFF